MPTVELRKVDKERLDAERKELPSGDRRKESYAAAFKRIFDEWKEMKGS